MTTLRRKNLHVQINVTDIDSALKFLDIDKNKFSAIHSTHLKKEHLLYKYLIKEFDCVKMSSGFNEPTRLAILSNLQKAYQFIFESDLIATHEHAYSDLSLGLTELDTRSIHRHNDVKQEDNISNQSIIEIAKKTSGVEPGFIAIQKNDLLLHLYRDYPERDKRIQFIRAEKHTWNSLYHLYKDELPKSMVKLSYLANDKGKIIVDEEDIGRSNAVKKITKTSHALGAAYKLVYKFIKETDINTVNIDAVKEVISNDIARCYGLKVQEQFLYEGRYPTKSEPLQLMLRGVWVDHATPIKPLVGDDKNERYCGSECLDQSKGIIFTSKEIKNLGRNYTSLLVIGDRDGIGSQGDNKLLVSDSKTGDVELFGIDFGKAFTANISQNVLPNMHIQNEDFKNYSVFYDQPRSSFVEGAILLAKIQGKAIPKEILASYSDDLNSKLQTIIEHADEIICDDYIKKFEDKQKAFQENNEHENAEFCKAIVSACKILKENVIQSRNEIISKFEFYLQFEKPVVDLLENLEKVMAGHDHTSICFNKVLLNHLRIDPALKMNWKFTQGDNAHIFTADFADTQSATEAYTWLVNFSKNKNLFLAELNGNAIEIKIPDDKLLQCSHTFKEEHIIEKYHQHHYRLQLHYKNERKLQQLLTQLSFLQSPELVFDYHQKAYEIKFKTIDLPEDIKNKILLTFQPHSDIKIIDTHEMTLTFQSTDIEKIIHIFNQISQALHDEKLLAEKNRQLNIRQLEAEKSQIDKELEEAEKILTHERLDEKNQRMMKIKEQLTRFHIMQNELSELIHLELTDINDYYVLQIIDVIDVEFYQFLIQHLDTFEHFEDNQFMVDASQLTAFNDALTKATQLWEENLLTNGTKIISNLKQKLSELIHLYENKSSEKWFSGTRNAISKLFTNQEAASFQICLDLQAFELTDKSSVLGVLKILNRRNDYHVEQDQEKQLLQALILLANNLLKVNDADFNLCLKRHKQFN